MNQMYNFIPTMDAPKNSRLTKEALDIIESKIVINEAKSDDYQQLDYFLSSSLGQNGYIIGTLKEKNISSYEAYVLERKKAISIRNPDVEGIILGNIIGAIEVLKKYLTKG